LIRRRYAAAMLFRLLIRLHAFCLAFAASVIDFLDAEAS